MKRESGDPDAKVEMVCPCGRKFWRWRSQVKWRGARYCSPGCQSRGAQRRRTAKCRQCNRVFDRPANVMAHPGRGKFCDRLCYSIWQREHRTRTVTLVCPICTKTFYRPAAWVKKGAGRACSRECAGVASRRSGSRVPRRGAAWRQLAQSIRDRDANVCVRCGEPERTVQSLNVDHIMPARMFTSATLADDPGNLASLCTSCHAIKTHRYEPRILRGDFLALDEFYGRDTRERTLRLLGADELSFT